ncbi:MAG TPA: hypothetical protein VGF59_23985, partial [Bryobacteraceae bacterium]
MTILKTSLALCCAGFLAFGATTMQSGKAQLKSAGPLAFGPDGVLFVGDSAGAGILALDVNDRTPAKSAGSIEIKAINEKIAAMLGTTADQITVQDVAVNPISKNVYLSVTRGKGPDAVPVILRADAAGKISEVSLENIPHQSVALPNPPAPPAADANPRARNQRMETITSLAYIQGNVIVAGLSNEEFSSTLRSIPYPFQAADNGAGIEIWHGSHGRFETNAPVRTFVPYEINHQANILAAYTCTPLVKIPVSELKAGAKVKGTTIAELGAGNRPLDMIVYTKSGKHFILMANSSRGVMKLPADGLESFEGITSRIADKSGVPYETIADLKGVQQLDK